MSILSKLFNAVIRFFAVWFVDTVALLITARLMPGINLQPVETLSTLGVAAAAAVTLGIVNLIIRPVLLLIAMPFGWMVIFLVGFFINAVTLMISAALMPGFEVNGWLAAFIGSLLISLINTSLITLLNLDEDESFYNSLIRRRAARQSVDLEADPGRGLVILESDGLSYQRIRAAIAEGYMPTLKQMMDEEGYALSHVDCGVPPTTPACQAGILQGNNDNIPAFRWLDKSTGKLMAGAGAAVAMEPLLSNGQGLLRDGTSIGNMFSGDAAKSILTITRIRTGEPEDKKRRAQDMYLLVRNPYFLTRTLVLFFADVLLELWQGWRQRRLNVLPRVNRLHKGYPFIRAAVNVFLRDVGTYFTILDVIRGAPAIYTLYAGYDEIAHYSGPYTHDADLVLRQFDRQVARVKKAIEEYAPRPYEILLLSDHGQSSGATFKQRYGMDILEFIQQQMPHGAEVAGTGGGDDGTIGVAAMLEELDNMQDHDQGGRIGKAAIKGTRRLLESNLAQQDSFRPAAPAKVTVAYGGNGAQVYFDLLPRRLTVNELNAAYPGMIDNIVQHDGIGFVIAYDDDVTPVVFGKDGARDLHTGEVTGRDPLLPFGDVELRAWQLRRMADFSNAGDLILNSTLYPDGTVAAMEELVGNHGGLGGEQTDAYLFHPGDMNPPPTRNSYEFKALIDARRDLPGWPTRPARPAQPKVNAWNPGVLARGLGQVSKWLAYAGQALALNRAAFRAIAADPYLTAPALLIAALAQVLQVANAGWNSQTFLNNLAFWWVYILFIYWGARILRGRGDFTATLRVVGFAQSAHILELLGFLPVIGPVARFLAVLLVFFATWIGVAVAHRLHGWRIVVLPFVYFLLIVVSVVFLVIVGQDFQFIFERVLETLGLAGV